MEQTRQTVEAQVLERAAKDPQFREQLMQDPRGTVARDFRVRIPPEITVEVMEETATKVYLVLPAALAQRGEELSSEELESVAGGWTAEGSACGATARCPTCGEYSCECW